MNKYLLDNPYIDDILYQPEALRSTIDGLAALQFDKFQEFSERLSSNLLERVVLTGMGSSLFALHPLRLRLIEHGIQTYMFETSELIHFAPKLLSPETLLVAVSQSGHSAEIVQLVDLLQDKVPCIGVTNTADSLLTEKSSVALVTQAGNEYSVSCKTYITALAGLSVLGDLLTGSDPAETLTAYQTSVNDMAQYLAHWKEYVDSAIQELAGIRDLILVGRGPSMAAVETGGLIIKETAQFHSEGMSSAAFRHGPFELVSPELFVLVYTGLEPTQQLNLNLAADIQNAGGRTELISRGESNNIFSLPMVPDAILPLFEILPSQLISIALAVLNQHTPGNFEIGTKVTEIP